LARPVRRRGSATDILPGPEPTAGAELIFVSPQIVRKNSSDDRERPSTTNETKVPTGQQLPALQALDGTNQHHPTMACLGLLSRASQVRILPGAQSYLVMPMMQDLLSLTHESARSSAGEPLLMSPLRPDAGRPISTADVVPTPPRGTVPGTNATSARPSPTVDPQLTAGWRQAEIRDSPSSRSENRPCDNRRYARPSRAWRSRSSTRMDCSGASGWKFNSAF
jgi:hypothetical protein